MIRNQKSKIKNQKYYKEVLKVLDVNINRVRESLRIIEDIVRFFLKQKKLTSTVKNFRERFKRIAGLIPQEELLAARQAGRDVGSKSFTLSEGRRKNTSAIFLANAKRAEESLRVLEEFSKLLSNKLGYRFKALRFKFYILEKRIGRLIIRKEKTGV